MMMTIIVKLTNTGNAKKIYCTELDQVLELPTFVMIKSFYIIFFLIGIPEVEVSRLR